ncbi:MAG: helix-turn-helix transcriptional regulator [Methylobacteriaceae bacterium]|nr:helix-turn-helix transcriptional regulator [Methylobacteriaceae bacterium]
MQPYLSTDEAAGYLRIKERKLYELVAAGALPCSKVTGKWLFPRAALDRWIESGLPPAQGAATAPPILAGSHDPLLEWAARRSGCGLALLAEGSGAGLERLARDEAMIAAIHLHGPDGDDESANPTALAVRADLADAVLIAFARREQGLLVAPGNPLGLDGLEAARRAGARFGLRQKGAGAQLLLERLLGLSGVAPGALTAAPSPFATGADLAAAIRAGEVDCGVATRAVAQALGLDFVALGWERFDLALRRRAYFEPGPQALFALMRSRDFIRQAERLGGYDVAEAGAVRLNR